MLFPFVAITTLMNGMRSAELHRSGLEQLRLVRPGGKSRRKSIQASFENQTAHLGQVGTEICRSSTLMIEFPKIRARGSSREEL